MTRILKAAIAFLIVLMFVASPAAAQTNQETAVDQPSKQEASPMDIRTPGYGWMGGGGRMHGGDWDDYHGPGMMGGGYDYRGPMGGYGRRDYRFGGRHRGMMRGGPGSYRYSPYGMRPTPDQLNRMKPEERTKFRQMWNHFQMETLNLRQKLAAKEMELRTRWDQDDLDRKKVQGLMDEIEDLRADLNKKRNALAADCRESFPGRTWPCPLDN